jgi:long-chain fatty acid transport protein
MSWANAYSWQYRSEGIAMALHDFQSSRSWEGAASEGVFSGLVLSFLRSSGEKLSSLALLFVAVLVMMATPGLSQAAGFALIQQGTAAMAQGNAFVAEANDPSAIFYNPAGLNQLKRPEIYINTTYNVPDREFHGPNGEFAQTNHRLFRTPSIYLVYPFHDRIAAGIGFFVPFGLGSMWHPEWAGRYITTFSKLKTYNINPALSVKILNNLSVAMGPNFLWSSVDLRRKLPMVVPTPVGPVQLPDGEAKLDGHAKGFGFNLGVLYEPLTGVKLGVSYRSAISVNYHGELDLTLPAPLPGQPKIPGTAKLTFPPSVTSGLSISRFRPLTLNFDVT